MFARLGLRPRALPVHDRGKDRPVLMLGELQGGLKLGDQFLLLQEGTGGGKRKATDAIDLPGHDIAARKARNQDVEPRVQSHVGIEIDLARILSSALRDRVPGIPSRQTMPQNTPQTGR